MEGGTKQTSQSYYEILGISVDSSADQIRRAYHKLAMRWHPDRWTKDPFRSGEAKQRFQQIQEAYSGTDLFGLFFEVFCLFVCLLSNSPTLLSENVFVMFSVVGWRETKFVWCRNLWFWRRWGIRIVILKTFKDCFVSSQKAELFLFLLWKGYFDFVQEMVSLMAETRREVKLLFATQLYSNLKKKKTVFYFLVSSDSR